MRGLLTLACLLLALPVAAVLGSWLLFDAAALAVLRHQAQTVLAGYAVEGETPRLGPMMLVPAKDVELIDTWFVGGMRGTGSQDFAVHDLFVPTAYTLNAADDAPLHPGPLYRLPLVLTLCSTLGPLALGLARGAIDCFVELIAAKVDRFTGTALRERLTVQERVAKAEAAVRSARRVEPQ